MTESSPAVPAEAAAECHVVTHVHWDREWYRPFESFRARLAELAEQVCAALDDRAVAAFHLDGQTIVLADIGAVRPDLEARLREHARAGRLAVGPWHVLADNQLVSGENLIRNLLTARRVAGDAGLSGVGYSPDAFGHPADLPRILAGFGMDTALVWRGAPPRHARFRWRSPDGSEVFAVNQAYHAAEVLWPGTGRAGEESAGARLTGFVDAERRRLPGGPWLLMNGGDHLAPSRTAARLSQLGGGGAAGGAVVRESTLAEFFTEAAKAAAGGGEPAVVEGELRHPGDRLTFLLPGTLSARTYLKQANAAAQTLMERWAEPAVALNAPGDATLRAELQHAWELLLHNAPHDSICGCSVDEVHRENEVRFERVRQVGEHVLARALAASGLDTRLYGEPPREEAVFAVLNPHGAPHTGPVEVEVLTAPDRFPAALSAPDGTEVPFEAEDLGPHTAFEADLELLPDSRPARRHRLRLLARDVPGLGRRHYRLRLGARRTRTEHVASCVDAADFTMPDGTRVAAAPDASLTLQAPGGTALRGFGRLLDGGDRGDTYNYDPPLQDSSAVPELRAVRRVSSAVRTGLEMDAVLTVPAGLSEDRSARSAGTVSMPVAVSVTSWHGDPAAALYWRVEVENTACDHRLRMHFPAAEGNGRWTGDGHYSLIERPVAADLGPLPREAGQEAVCGSAPVQSTGAIGLAGSRVAVAAPGLPEMRGLRAAPHGGEELVVTLLRSVGWLSRFDLRSRTTGAGPMLPTPGAQCPGPQSFALTTAVGRTVAEDTGLARFAAAGRAPLRAWQIRPGTTAPAPRPPLRIDGGLLSALKHAEDGNGLIVRISNPTGTPLPTTLHLPHGTSAAACRLDESPAGHTTLPAASRGRVTWTMRPYALASIRLTGPLGPGAPAARRP